MSRYPNRAAYDAAKNGFPKDQQWQFWPPPLYLATWREVPGILAWKLAGAVVVVVGLIAGLAVFGMMMDGAAYRSEEHSRCMKHATNGYEIEQCR
jgi:hypothetical protein